MQMLGKTLHRLKATTFKTSNFSNDHRQHYQHLLFIFLKDHNHNHYYNQSFSCNKKIEKQNYMQRKCHFKKNTTMRH